MYRKLDLTFSAAKMPSFVPYNLLTQHSIPDKSIADCVEALIGAYLISSGAKGALRFMQWLGMDFLSPAKQEETKEGGDDASSGVESEKSKNLPPICEEERRLLPPSPLFPDVTSPQTQLNALLNGYDAFEDLIGYRSGH